LQSPQTPLLQQALWQSTAAEQNWPRSQLGQVLPPQSTSVSSPFLMRSVHDGGAF
jgi:hypothetical protein